MVNERTVTDLRWYCGQENQTLVFISPVLPIDPPPTAPPPAQKSSARSSTRVSLDPRLRAFICIGGLSLLIWFLILALRNPFKPGKNTFSDFYYAALALRHGEPIAQIKGYIYPPLMAWLLQPLTHLPIALALRGWQAFTFLLTTSSLWIGYREIARRFGFPRDWKTALTIIFAALILSAGEAKTEWSVAQCDSLVLDSFVFSLALLESSPLAAGAIIALGANIKYQTLILLPYLLWRRQFKAAFFTVVFGVAFALLPAISMGWTGVFQSWGTALGGLGVFVGLHPQTAAEIHPLAWDHSISITSAMARILPTAGFSQNLAFPVSGLIAGLGAFVIATVYFRNFLPLAGRLPKQSPLLVLEWSAVMVALLAFGPQTTRRHLFILLFFHLIIAAHLLLAKLSRKEFTWLASALVIYELGLRLPPSAKWSAAESDAWKFIAGPSWCLLVMLLALFVVATHFRAKAPGSVLRQ